MTLPTHDRIPRHLFQEDGHYLGRPADFEDRIISRRIRLVESVPGFIDADLNLLDIGCGNGASMFMLADRFAHCVGIEISNIHRDAFERRRAELGIRNCEYRISDVVAERPQERFDRIISFEVIEHLSDESGLRYYNEALSENGLLAITVPNKWWIFETHGAKLSGLPWNRIPFLSWLPTPLHERIANARIYTLRRITRLLKAHGFDVIRSQYVTAPMDVLPDGRIKDWVTRTVFNTDSTVIPFKATSLFVVARKVT